MDTSSTPTWLMIVAALLWIGVLLVGVLFGQFWLLIALTALIVFAMWRDSPGAAVLVGLAMAGSIAWAVYQRG